MLNFSWKSISLASPNLLKIFGFAELASPNLLKIFGFAESSENIWLRRIF